MKLNTQIVDKQGDNWISLTGYRILFVLKLLLEQGRSVDELITLLQSNKYTNKSLSKDTVRIALNTIKSAGCKLSRPVKTNGFKYEVISHPFGLFLSDSETEFLFKLRQKIAENISWEEILELNQLYEKFFALTFNENQKLNEIETRPFANINNEVLNILINNKLENKKINLIYNSPKNGEENLDVIYKKLKYNNEKLYLWCYIYKYKVNNYLNLEKVKSINSISVEDYYENNNTYEVIYKIYGESALTFQKKDYETIIEKTQDYITVKASVINDFWFIQRILLFGSDVKIISPEAFKEKMIDKIKQIKAGYKNGNI